MYEDLYGLDSRPFDLTPDPRFLLLTPKHREALTLARYVLSGRAGLALLVGEAGTGKTTLLRAALDDPGRDGDCAVTLDNPTLTREEFFEFLADGFHLGPGTAGSKTRVLRELNRVLSQRHQGGGVSALVVDEAQSLSDELLEEIRLLANIETQKAKLLSILLAGQPELAQRLNEPRRWQLKQRIALRGVLEPLTLPETADYIGGRLRIAGGDLAQTFTRDAVQAVFAHAGGIPRTISVICENALITGFAMGARPIDCDIVMEVCRDLDLRSRDGETPPRTAGGGAPLGEHVPSPVAVPAATAAPAGPSPDPGQRVVEWPVREEGRDGAPGRRRVLDLLPFWKRREPVYLPLQAQYFEVDGRRGVLVTPVAEGRPAGKPRTKAGAAVKQ